jgi:hypothetical protein
MTDIRFDLQQYYSMKVLFERILGKNSFMRVKDYGSLQTWKAESIKLLKAINFAIESTVEIADDDWRSEVRRLLEIGQSLCKSSQSIDDLFSILASTLGKLAFLQIGFFPDWHSKYKNIPLLTSRWKLDQVRSVQYVQSKKQLETQKRLNTQYKQSNET